MKLAVLSVASPFVALGDDAVGGAEQVLVQLDAALVRAGHRSVVVAAEGSLVAGTLIATRLPAGMITDDVRRRVQQQHARNISLSLHRYDIDLVHFHGIDFHEYLPRSGPPALVTLHLPPSWYPSHIFRIDRPNTYLHCVSAAQRRSCLPCANLIGDIPNGVSADELAFNCSKRRYAMILGRICPEKNFHVALDAAARADIPAYIGGRVFPYEMHYRYFDEHIAPRLDARRRFLGPLPLSRRRRLLSGARCLLLPTLAPETCSLVAMESLACGTPVIAFPSGVLPEIIDDGVTGFLVTNTQEMAEAIDAAGGLDPVRCREAAARRFSHDRMIARYFDVYRQLARQRRATSAEVAAHDWNYPAASAGWL